MIVSRNNSTCHYFCPVGSLGKLQNQCWVPLVAKQFPATSPFMGQNSPTLKIPEVHSLTKTRSIRRKEKDKEVKFENPPK